MTDIELYRSALKYLLSQEGISEADLKMHLACVSEKPRDISIIFMGLCESAQNRQMSNIVIGQSIDGWRNLGRILFDFDPHQVSAKYSRTDSLRLLEDVKNILKPRGQVRSEPNSLWPQFCQTVIDSAYFLDSFRDADAFYKWADFFANDPKSKPALPLLISLEIKGFGFPLACDFLKEIGYMEYGKPDVHLKDIFCALGLLDSDESPLKQNYLTLKIIDRIAQANGVTPYAVDKVFWLIGSGNFYLTNKRIGPHKKAFLNGMVNNMKPTESHY